MNKQDCLEKILNFLEKENTHGNINYFLTFKFDELRKRDRSYSKFRAERDEDSFWLTRYINYLVYHDMLPNMSNLDEMNEFYGGDTINPIYNSQYYLTIGNFMLLPKLSYNQHTTFNTYKYSCFKDDLSQFLEKFQEIYNNIKFIFDCQKANSEYIQWLNRDYNIEWVKLVKSNKFYFDVIDSYDKFLKANFLEDFQKENIEMFIQNRSKKICNKLAAIL